jgi:tetratricopeptide (TPR) repeat protein
MRTLLHANFFISLLFIFSAFSAHAEINDEIKQLQQEWAKIKYTLDKKEHEKALENLANQITSLREKQPDNADAYLWEGIIYSTYAGAIGTLRALKAVTHSRDALEQSINIDSTASKGAAHTFLGALYFLVPEWPIAFGDLDLSKEHLDKAIAMNPDGIDINFFYGDFMKKLGKFKQAEAMYLKALDAPARPGRELADEGRRKETKERLEKVRYEMSKPPPPKI